MKNIIISAAIVLFAAIGMTGCKDGSFGGDYEVESVKLKDMCGTWVCTVESNDPWFTMYYYSEEKGYTPEFVNANLGDPYGKYNADANGDGIVDEKDFAIYTEQELWYDEFGAGIVQFITANTADDNSSEMLLQDKFRKATYRINVNPNDMTFSAGTIKEAPYQTLAITPATITSTYDNGGKPVVIGGKIMKKAATAPGSGMKTDSICFYVKYADDYGPDMYYKVSGYLKTGYTEDD